MASSISTGDMSLMLPNYRQVSIMCSDMRILLTNINNAMFNASCCIGLHE